VYGPAFPAGVFLRETWHRRNNMAKKITPKRRGAHIEMRTIVGKDGRTYLGFRYPRQKAPGHSYHYFAEVETKATIRNIIGRRARSTVKSEDYEHAWNLGR
jgi:hypothetical protein